MNPFEHLRAHDRPVAPDRAFAARLRGRLVAALATDPLDLPTIDLPERTNAMTDIDTHTTSSTTSITAYIAVHDAAAAIEWYTTVFAAVETTRYVGDDGRVGHADLRIGDATLMLSDEHPEIGVVGPRTLGGTSTALHLVVPDVDAVWAQALEHGADGQRPPEDQPYGERVSTFVDPFGHRWMVATTIASPTIDEIQAASPDYTITAAPLTGSAPVEVGYLTMGFDDTERAARFYGELFGWRAEPGNAGDQYRHVGNTRLPVGLTPDGVDSSPVLYFRVADADAMADRVTELGGTVVDRASYASGASVVCHDDQGREFQLWQPAPGY